MPRSGSLGGGEGGCDLEPAVLFLLGVVKLQELTRLVIRAQVDAVREGLDRDGV